MTAAAPVGPDLAAAAPVGPDLTATDRERAVRLYLAVGRLTRTLRRTGGRLSAGSVSALGTVAATGPIRAGDLAAREGVAAPTLSRILATLEELGLLERAPDPQDGRSVLISVTAAGRAELAQLRARRTDALLERMARLDPTQRDSLLSAVEALEALTED